MGIGHHIAHRKLFMLYCVLLQYCTTHIAGGRAHNVGVANSKFHFIPAVARSGVGVARRHYTQGLSRCDKGYERIFTVLLVGFRRVFCLFQDECIRWIFRSIPLKALKYNPQV